MSPLSIVELEARHVRIPMRRTITHASHSRSETDNLVVRCRLSDGSVGFGEAVPRDYVTGETIDFALDLLKRSNLAKQFAPCADFSEAVSCAERLSIAIAEGDDRRIGGNAARCAVELAILDAYGRAFGEPMMNVVKILAPELYEPRSWVQYSGAITKAKGWKARAYPLIFRMFGFRQMKLKVGISGYDDIKRTNTVRRWAGKKMDIRVDANEAWRPEEVEARVRELEPAQLSSIEQPVRHEDVACLAEIRTRVSMPFMLDESLCGMVDAERAVAGMWCSSFNLRLSKCGGFIPTLRLAEYAQRNGMTYQLGCQVGETGILSAAGRHFASSVRGILAIEGSYDRHLVWESLTTEDLTFKRGGWAPALVGCGLGVTIDQTRVDWVTKRTEKMIG